MANEESSASIARVVHAARAMLHLREGGHQRQRQSDAAYSSSHLVVPLADLYNTDPLTFAEEQILGNLSIDADAAIAAQNLKRASGERPYVLEDAKGRPVFFRDSEGRLVKSIFTTSGEASGLQRNLYFLLRRLGHDITSEEAKKRARMVALAGRRAPLAAEAAGGSVGASAAGAASKDQEAGQPMPPTPPIPDVSGGSSGLNSANGSLAAPGPSPPLDNTDMTAAVVLIAMRTDAIEEDFLIAKLDWDALSVPTHLPLGSCYCM